MVYWAGVDLKQGCFFPTCSASMPDVTPPLCCDVISSLSLSPSLTPRSTCRHFSPLCLAPSLVSPLLLLPLSRSPSVFVLSVSLTQWSRFGASQVQAGTLCFHPNTVCIHMEIHINIQMNGHAKWWIRTRFQRMKSSLQSEWTRQSHEYIKGRKQQGHRCLWSLGNGFWEMLKIQQLTVFSRWVRSVVNGTQFLWGESTACAPCKPFGT